MKWTVKSVYFYLVSFVMLLTLVFGTVTFVNNIIEMFNPSRMYGYDKESVALSLRDKYRQQNPTASEEEIMQMARAEAERMYDSQLQQDFYYRWRSLIQSAVLILIAGPTYRYHWRRAQAVDV